MPYSTDVTVYVLSGGTLQLEAKLWELWTTIDNADRLRHHQSDQETVTVGSGGGGTASFTQGPSFLNPLNHSIALSVERQGDPGPSFRSGSFDTLPAGAPGDPAGLVEVLIADQVTIDQFMLNASLPAVPMAVSGDSSSTITGITVTPGTDVLNIVATGTTARAPLVTPVAFTYTAGLTFAPSWDQRDTTQVLEVGATTPSIAFASTGTWLSTVEAGLLNVIGGLVEKEITPVVVRTIESRMNAGALSAAAATIGALSGTTMTSLPPGVVLSVRRVNVRSAGVIVAPALGAYGGLISKFPSSSSGGGSSRCALSTIAALSVPALDLDAFRAYRDTRLAQRPGLVRAYYAASPMVAAALRAAPPLRRPAAVLALAAQSRVRRSTTGESRSCVVQPPTV